jgi:hypothetical protein
VSVLTALASNHATVAQSPVSTEIRFSRTGMKLNGVLLNGTFDFKFKLFDDPSHGNRIGPIISVNGLNITNGSLPTAT